MSQAGVSHLAVKYETRVERTVSISHLAAALQNSSSPTDPISSIGVLPCYLFPDRMSVRMAQQVLVNGGAALRIGETLDLITEMDLVKWMVKKNLSVQNGVANGTS